MKRGVRPGARMSLIAVRGMTRASSVAAAVLLAGCAAQRQPLYHWGGYQPQLYEYFKGEKGPEAQILALESEVEKARSKGLALPPGFNAHLGLLYGGVARDDQFRQQLEMEKTQFPESSAYMDFLLRKFKSGQPGK